MAIEVPRGDGEVKGGSGPPMTLGSAAGAGVRFIVWGPPISTSDFHRAVMMVVDQAAKAMKEARRSRPSSKASISPPTATCGSMGVRVATWSSQGGLRGYNAIAQRARG
jgi:hypothetical protein